MSRRPAVLLPALLLAAACLDHARAQDAPEGPGNAALSKAVRKARADLEAGKKRLIATRQRIADERLKKAAELTRLEGEVARLRERWREHVLVSDARGSRLTELDRESRRLEQLLDGTWNTLIEARRNAETHFSLLDRKAFEGDLARTDELLDRRSGATGPGNASHAVLTLLLGHIRACSRVRRMPGSAIDGAGRERTGTFVQIGGVGALFAGKEKSDPAGLVRMQHGSSHPHVRSFAKEGERESVLGLANGRTATVPLDVSGGAALRSLRAQRSLLEEVRAGGPVMIPILALAVVCVLVGIWKVCRLWRIPVASDSRVMPFARSLFSDREKAGELAAKARGPLRRLLGEAFAHAEEPRDQLEEVLHEAILAEVPVLESKLSVLSVGAAIAPLLGLLGTVTGMIHTFRLISVFGSGDARMLSGGISEALVTTEAGLIVAIPLLLLHAVLARRVRAIADGLEGGALAILNECPAAASRTGTTP